MCGCGSKGSMIKQGKHIFKGINNSPQSTCEAYALKWPPTSTTCFNPNPKFIIQKIVYLLFLFLFIKLTIYQNPINK